MKLAELSKEPQLIKITVDKKELVEKYGDEIEFFIYDRQPLDIFTRLANSDKDMTGVTELIQEMILDEKGEKIVSEGKILPLDVLMECVSLISNKLGK